MRRIALLLALAAVPATAQEPEPEGRGLMGRGAELMMRRLLEEVAPEIGDLGTAMGLLEGVIGSLGDYEAPEILPGGDILIRRKRETAPPVEPGDGEVEL